MITQYRSDASRRKALDAMRRRNHPPRPLSLSLRLRPWPRSGRRRTGTPTARVPGTLYCDLPYEVLVPFLRLSH